MCTVEALADAHRVIKKPNPPSAAISFAAAPISLNDSPSFDDASHFVGGEALANQ